MGQMSGGVLLFFVGFSAMVFNAATRSAVSSAFDFLGLDSPFFLGLVVPVSIIGSFIVAVIGMAMVVSGRMSLRTGE